MPITGIDVSSHNGPIDWPTAAASGISFAYAKTTDGITFIDPSFKTNWAGIVAAGLFVGGYHFFEPNDAPTAQADNYLADISSVNGGTPVLGPGCLAPALDVETSKTFTPAQIGAAVQTWLNVVAAATGRTPIVYTGTPFWNSSVFAGIPTVSSPLWLAQYPNPPVPAAPHSLPNPWSSHLIWQWSESATVPGVTGHVDADLFNGSLADLQAFAGIATPIVATPGS